jgi:hypothetical protein
MMSLEAPLIHRAASSLIRDAAAPIAAIGSIANMNIGSYVIEFIDVEMKEN